MSPAQADLFAPGPQLDGLATRVRETWVAFLAEPEAADALTVACQEACRRARAGQTWINGDHLLDAMRAAGHPLDNRLRGPTVRYVLWQHPSLAPLFRIRKRAA